MEDQEKKLPQVITESFQEKKQWFQEFHDKFKFFTPSIITSIITVICLIIIVVALFDFFNTSYGNIINFLSTWGIKLFKFALPLLTKVFYLVLKLVTLAMTTLWIPSIIYIGIYMLVKTQWLRILLSFTALSLIYLLVLKTLQVDFTIFSTILDIYFFILLITPKFVWRWISGLLVFIAGLFLAMLPNIPIPVVGGTVDFGIFSGLFLFLFFFIHNLASFIQLFANIFGDNFNLSANNT